MSQADASFFDYHCDFCDEPVCERIQIMNLSLNYVERLYCMNCLATELAMAPNELSEFAKAYVYSRDCFKTPWDKFSAVACPRLKTQQCFCQD